MNSPPDWEKAEAGLGAERAPTPPLGGRGRRGGERMRERREGEGHESCGRWSLDEERGDEA
jgi:hypothetical protein